MNHREWEPSEKEWINFCDNWRRDYNSLSPQDHIRLYDQLFDAYPSQEQHQEHYVSHFLRRFVPEKDLHVLELGGYNGELARKIIANHNCIKSWTNYDLTKHAIANQTCGDPRYKCIVMDDKFLWDLPPTRFHNTFVSCHTIEHLNEEHCREFLSWIKDSTFEYVFMEIYVDLYIEDTPEAKKYHFDHFYMGTVSTHILTLGWNKINSIMLNNGFTQMYHPHNTVFAYTRRRPKD